MLPPPWINFTVALAIGLLIGVERERTKGEGPLRRAAGIRTFALASLLGAVAMHVGGVPVLALALAATLLLTALSYLRGSREDPGLTTEIALVLTPLLGALAMADTLVELARLYAFEGRDEESLPLYDKACAIRVEKLGMHHPQTAICFEEFAQALHRLDRIDEAEELQERAREVRGNHTQIEEEYASEQAPLL